MLAYNTTDHTMYCIQLLAQLRTSAEHNAIDTLAHCLSELRLMEEPSGIIFSDRFFTARAAWDAEPATLRLPCGEPPAADCLRSGLSMTPAPMPTNAPGGHHDPITMS